MSTVGIVVLALLGGLFLAILIGAVCVLIWVCWKLNETARKTLADMSAMVDGLNATAQKFETQLHEVLKTHAAAFDLAVSKINGEGLAEASKIIVLSASRIERACVAFGELAKALLADRDTIAENGAGLRPDEYATPEPDEKFIAYNPTARGDREAANDPEGDELRNQS